MEEFMTPDRIANAIMLDSRFNGYYLIVEGKKDVNLYGKFVAEHQIRIKPAFGNEKVKKVLQILDEQGFDRRVGIIDADFKKILNINSATTGLFITDDHDIEVMVIKTKALESVINLYCSKEKIKRFEESKGISIRDALFLLGKEIGYLKLANKIYNLGLVFKPQEVEGNQIKYSNFTCNNTLNFLGVEKLLETTINYSRNRNTLMKDKATIEENLSLVSQGKYDLFQLVNGHDLSNFLFILMKKVLKSSHKMLIDFSCVEDSLVLAYEYSYFKETELYNQILNWSHTNNLTIFK